MDLDLPDPTRHTPGGRRRAAGKLPPRPPALPLLSMEEIRRLTDPEPEEVEDLPEPVTPEPPPPDPTQLTLAETEEFQGVLAEIVSRKSEALRIFRPMPEQERFFASDSPERLAIGGNRGGKAQPVDEPVLTPDGWQPIGSLRVGDVVIGGDGKPCVVTGVFPQGVKPVSRVTFDDGAWTRCCDEHLWKVGLRRERFGALRGQDHWRVLSLGEIRAATGDRPTGAGAPVIPVCEPWMPSRSTPIDPYVLGLLLGDGSTRGGSLKITTADDEIRDAIECSLGPPYELRHASRYDYRVVYAGGRGNPLVDACRFLGIWDKLAREKRVPRDYLFNTADVRLAVLQGLMDTDGSITDPAGMRAKRGQSVEFCTASPGLAEDVSFLVRSLGGKCRATSRITSFRTKSGELRQGHPSIRLRISLQGVCPFRLARKASRWTDRRGVTRNRILRSVEPAGEAECACISVSSPDQTYVTRDLIVTHNTTVTCVEIARAVTGQDPYDKYPKEGGKCILVGLDLTHCSKVFYQKLFRPGAFKMIKDEATGEWRPWNPNDPRDQERVKEARKAPPLIPARFYDYSKIAWENKKDEIPKTIPLKTGWTIYFFSSKGAPPQGWNVDLVAFDEEVEHPLWYPEMSARLLDNQTVDPETGKVRSGKFIWSATPQNATETLYNLWSRSEECKDEPIPPIMTCEFGMLANPFVADKAKLEFVKKFENNEDEIAVRVYGKFALMGTRVYPEFMPKGVHGIESFPIPDDWTSYAIVDPGRQVCAVLFVAVPPPTSEYAGHKIIYDELYIKRCNAQIFAEQFVKKVNGRPIQCGIIDHRAGRITEIGSGKTHEQQYSDALKATKFKFEQGGVTFQWSSDDVKAGIEAVRNALHIVDGRSELLVMWEKCKSLLGEMERYSYKRLPSGVVTDEPIKLNDHLCDTVRYAMMARLKYVRPRKRAKQKGYTLVYLEQKKERERQRRIREDGYGGAIRVG